MGTRVTTVSRVNRLLVGLLVVVVGGATLAACSAADGGSREVKSATVTSSDAREWVSAWQSASATTIEWADCDEVPGAECSVMTVPLDWSDPTGRTIDLPLRRYPAHNDAAPPLLLLAGGPGGSGTELVTDIAEDNEALRQDYTLISLDPRGVWGPQGADQPLDCPEDADSCDPSSELSRFATTSDVAMDLENLRIALGGEPLHAVSYSYGTYIAAVYVTLFPESAARIVFDGAAPAFGFTPLGTERQMIAFEDALDRFIDACLAGEVTACPLSGDGDSAKAQLIELRARLNEAPVELSSDADKGALDGDYFRDIVLSELYQPRSNWDHLALLIRDFFVASGDVSGESAEDGADGANESVARGHSGSKVHGTSDSGVATGIAHAVMCAIPGATEPVVREDLVPLHGDDYFFIRDSGDSASDAAEAIACATELPAHLDPVISYAGPEQFLVTSTTGDPATPFSDAATLADQLNAALLPVEAEGHTAVFGQSACVTAATLRYLNQGVIPEEGTVCAA